MRLWWCYLVWDSLRLLISSCSHPPSTETDQQSPPSTPAHGNSSPTPFNSHRPVLKKTRSQKVTERRRSHVTEQHQSRGSGPAAAAVVSKNMKPCPEVGFQRREKSRFYFRTSSEQRRHSAPFYGQTVCGKFWPCGPRVRRPSQ